MSTLRSNVERKEKKMKIFLIIVGAIIVANLINLQLNKMINPLIKKASTLVWQSRFLRLTLSKIPEGQLLCINNQKIFQIGEAMLIDGAPTKEINSLMLNLLENEMVTEIPKCPIYSSKFAKYPGYMENEIVDAKKPFGELLVGEEFTLEKETYRKTSDALFDCNALHVQSRKPTFFKQDTIVTPNN